MRLCRVFAELYHWTPDQTLAQDLNMLYDLLRDHNLEDNVSRLRDKNEAVTLDDVRSYLMAYNDDDPYEPITYDQPPAIRF